MDPKHVTVLATLVAGLVLLVIVQIVVAIRLLKDRSRPDPRTLGLGLLAAVGSHLAVFGLTGSPWPAVLAVAPFAIGAAGCIPRPLLPPPRRTRATADVLEAIATPAPGPVGGADPRSQSKIGPDPATGAVPTLSTSEQQAWETIRREFGEE